LATATALAAGGCGGSDDGPGGASTRLTVSAAASLTEAIDACAQGIDYARVRPSFAGSDELAGQIRQGIKPDVFAAANTKLPEQLAAEGLLERPVVFATNSLVVAVPAGSPIRRLDDLAAARTTVAIGAEGVPVGGYARTVLARLPAARERAILANVRTEEPDVKGVIGKLTQGAVDAGFVYASDVMAAGSRLRTVEIPAGLEPQVEYGAGVVRGAPQPDAAARFIEDLRTGACSQALRARGFGPPPG
jgi:molybdate transport system substrate-binding protein